MLFGLYCASLCKEAADNIGNSSGFRGHDSLSGHFYRGILAVINLFSKFENCSVNHSKYMKEDF